MTYVTPGFGKRLLCLLYEFLLVLAILFIASLLFHVILKDPTAPYFKPLHQFYLLTVMGYYFIWFWTRGGQTLAMQTWKMRLVTTEGKRLTKRQAITRYLLALLGYFFFGVSVLWALFDREKQFLHDRLIGTRIIVVQS